MTSSCAIVVPLYRSELSANEMVSISRCYELWEGSYDIIVVAPEGVDMSGIAKKFPCIKFSIVDCTKMSSIAQYNKMLLSRDFYALFSGYDYILIYQADCYVFEDRLGEWLSKGYDYVGAPWYYGIDWFTKFSGSILRSLRIYHGGGFLWGQVGNGGFSLRKISAFTTHLESCKKFSKRASRGKLNEDVYWSLTAKGLKKPTAREAAHFAADMTPTICPHDVMAAHGWNKNQKTIEFWKEKINGIAFDQLKCSKSN